MESVTRSGSTKEPGVPTRKEMRRKEGVEINTKYNLTDGKEKEKRKPLSIIVNYAGNVRTETKIL